MCRVRFVRSREALSELPDERAEAVGQDRECVAEAPGRASTCRRRAVHDRDPSQHLRVGDGEMRGAMTLVDAPVEREPFLAGQLPSLVPWIVRVGVWIGALTSLASLCLLAIVHFDDIYLVNQVSGAWMGLAMYANNGVLYPPLFNGESFGGTRHMPLQFVLHAGFAQIFGDYLQAGKALSLAVTAGLALALWGVFRQLLAPAWLTIGLLACVLMSQVGQLGSLSIRGHALPVALQVAALGLVARRPDRRSVVLAGLLCALALLTKLTAVWGILACLVWLWPSRRALAVTLVAVYGVALVVGLASIELLSDGRFSENLFGLSASAFEEPLPALAAGALRKLVSLSETSADATWLLAPIAATGVLVALRRRSVSVYQIALVTAVVLTAIVMADIGAGDSHLLDVHVLIAVVVAQAWRDHVREGAPERAAFVAPLVAVTIIVAIGGSYATQMAEKTRDAALVALGRETNRFAVDDLDAHVPPGAVVLSEDSTVPVILGQLPVVLDPFMLTRMGRAHPEWVDSLVQRLDRKEFDRVVLFNRPGFALDGSNSFWRELHFGPGVIEAIARNYRPAHVVSGYEIRVRRSG